MKNNTLNLNDITAQIKQYVRQIKDNKKSEFSPSLPDVEYKRQIHYTNDIRSNINKLHGNNKFSLHNMLSSDTLVSTSAEYASEAYGHLSSIEEKHKVVIDFMHKNNKNFDLKA